MVGTTCTDDSQSVPVDKSFCFQMQTIQFSPFKALVTESHILDKCTLINTGFSSWQEYCMTEYLRMSGVYWGLTAMALMSKLDKMEKEEVIEFVKSCQHESGGFSATVEHDPHLLYTLSAIQVGFIAVLNFNHFSPKHTI